MSESRALRVQLVHPMVTAWREPGVLHIGFDGRSFVLRGVPQQLGHAIELLAEPRTRRELAARLPGLDPAWITWLCQHLSTAGLLTHPSDVMPRPVLISGRGTLATSTMAMLRTSRLRPRQLPEHADLLPHDALVVVAAATAEPDRLLLNDLAKAGIEHLVVRAEPSRAVVGPLVDPAGGPCVRCDDLARARLDRGWPVLLAQLCTTEVRPDAGLCAWAAATAATAVRARLAGAPSELLGRSIELGLGEFRLRSRRWPLQPECGCHGHELWAGSGTLAG